MSYNRLIQVPHEVSGTVITVAAGRMAAYAADSGLQLWDVETRVGIIAPPITYEVNGVQYLGVLAGWGGDAIFGEDRDIAPGFEYENEGRLVVFKLAGRNEEPGSSAAADEKTDLPG